MKLQLPFTILVLAAGHLAGTARGDDSHAFDDALAAEAQALAEPFVVEHLDVDPEDCIHLGQWGGVIPWTPHIPVSAANLPDGRILTYASNQRTTFPGGVEFTYAATWNPATGQFNEYNHPSHDMFCGALVMLPDGRVLVSGGTNRVVRASVFDWRNNQWTRIQNMNDGRWYNTSVALPNGNVWTATGSGTGTNTAERWNSTTGWTRLSGIPWNTVFSDPGYIKEWHPFVALAPDGRLLHFGPTNTMHWITHTETGSMTNSGTTVPGTHYPKEGCWIMYAEGRILVAGGGANTTTRSGGDGTTGTSTKAAYTVDMNTTPPTIASTSPMIHARQFANAVVLPSGEVLVIGGNSGLKFNDTGSILPCEIWNPSTGQWRAVASISVPRNYHSVALLLPDGRVWSGGGGLSGNAADHRDAQLYTPPCLFDASGSLRPRPSLTAAPVAVGPGGIFQVNGTPGLAKFALVKMSAITHSVNTDVRFLSLPFAETEPGTYQLTAHANINTMTTGYWMLFGIAPDGSYSVAKTLRVDASAPVNVTHPGDQSGIVGTPVDLTILAPGANSPPLTFSASNLPAGLAIGSANGRITGTPTTAQTRNVIVFVTDGTGSQSSVSFVWTIAPALSVTLPGIPPRAAGASLSFTAQSNGPTNASYRWNFGDGSPLTSPTPSPNASHTYAAPGRYLVTVTATSGSQVASASFHQAIHAPLTSSRPNASTAIVATATRVWCVNPDNNSVSVFDAATRARLAEIPVGANPRTLALAPDGRLWVACADASTIAIVNPATLAVDQSVPLARGSRPFGLAFAPDGSDAWVACEGSGKLLRLHPATAQETAALEIGPHARQLSINSDGSRVYVSRFITPPAIGESTGNPGEGAGEVVAVDSAAFAIERTIRIQMSDRPDSATSGRGIPNYLGPAVISPDGLSAWVASKQDNIQRGVLRDGNPLTHDLTVRAIASRLDLSAGTPATDELASRLDHDNAGVPSTTAFDPSGVYLFTVIEGSREVAVSDAWNRIELLRFPAGRAPQGIALSPDGRTAYVQNFMDRTITVHDLGGLLDGLETPPALVATLKTVATEALSGEVLLGKQLFYDAVDERLALQRYISCAACHNNGDHDGRVWDLTGFGEGLRNTIDLRGRAGLGHGALHWSGNFDEVQDFEGQIRALSGGSGLIANGNPHPPMGAPNTGRSADLDALAAYVASLATVDASPYRNQDGTLTPDGQAGKAVFAAENCAQCHSGSTFTDSAPGVLHDIGTLKASSGSRLGGTLPGLDTPTLRGLWHGAPYLHDGSAATLADALDAHAGLGLGATERAHLVAYLLQIDALETTAPVPGAEGGIVPGASTIALYHLNGNSDDASPNALHLTAAGGVEFVGNAARFHAVGDTLSVPIPDALVLPGNGSPLSIDFRIFPRNWLAYGLANLPIVSLYQEWNSYLALEDQKWGTNPRGPNVQSSNGIVATAAQWAAAVVPNQWNRVRIVFDGSHSVSLSVNDLPVATAALPPLVGRTNAWQLTLGNFDGDLDEVHLARSIPASGPDTRSPVPLLTGPSGSVAGSFTVMAIFDEPVTGFAPEDIALVNATASAFSGSGTTYQFTVAPVAEGPVEVGVPAGAAADAAGNPSLASNTLTLVHSLPPSGGGDERVPDANTVALYHFNNDFRDSSTNGFHLAVSGSVPLVADNLGWMGSPDGKVARFTAIGDALTATLPDAAVLPGGGQPLTIEARIYPRAWLGYAVGNLPVIALHQEWNSHFILEDQKWGVNPKGPAVKASNATLVTGEQWSNAVTPNAWNHVRIIFDGITTTSVWINGNPIASASLPPSVGRTNPWSLTLGNFSGDIDEVYITRSIIPDGPDETRPTVTLSTASPIVSGSFTVDADFSEAVGGFSLSVLTVTNGSASVLTGGGDRYAFTVTPLVAGTVTVRVPASAVTDGAGNPNTASNLLAVTHDDNPPPSGDDEYLPDTTTVALYHFTNNYQDSSGNGLHLTPSGSVFLSGDNLGWMATPGGQVARFSAIGDTLTATLPDHLVLPAAGTPLTLEARIFPRAWLAYSVANLPVVSLFQEWDSSLDLVDAKWGTNPRGPRITSADIPIATAAQWAARAPLNTWSLLQISFDGNGTVSAWINGQPTGSVALTPNIGRANPWTLTLGNFSGDIDEVLVRRAPPLGAASEGLAAITASEAVMAETLVSAGLGIGPSAPVEDPDGDGWSNQLEVALGSNPAGGDSPVITIATNPDGLPTLTFPIPSSARNDAHGFETAAFLYRIEISKNLNNWEPAAFTESARLPGTPGFDVVTVTIDAPPSPRSFLRLRVEGK